MYVFLCRCSAPPTFPCPLGPAHHPPLQTRARCCIGPALSADPAKGHTLISRFKRVGPNAMRGRGIGAARGRATIQRGESCSWHTNVPSADAPCYGFHFATPADKQQTPEGERRGRTRVSDDKRVWTVWLSSLEGPLLTVWRCAAGKMYSECRAHVYCAPVGWKREMAFRYSSFWPVLPLELTRTLITTSPGLHFDHRTSKGSLNAPKTSLFVAYADMLWLPGLLLISF